MVKLRRQKLSGKLEKKFSLFLDIYFEGRRQYEFLKLYLGSDKPSNRATLTLAESIRAKRELELQNDQYGFIPEYKKKINFVDYFERITKEKEKSHIYNNTLKHVRDFTGGFIQLRAIDEKWISEFSNYLHTKVKHNSVIVYFNSLKAVLNRAVKNKLIQTNPFAYFDNLKKVETFKTYLIFDEVQKLADTDCKKPDVKRAFLFGCYTGLRISDIMKLQWNDIKEDHIEFRQKKTGEIVYFPMSGMLRKILFSSRDNILNLPENNVFTLQSERINARYLKEWTIVAGIRKDVTWHTARHTFATMSLSSGTDLYTVSKLLGHSDIKLTQVYAKVVDELKRKAVDSLPEIQIS